MRRPATLILFLPALVAPAIAHVETEARQDKSPTSFGKKAISPDHEGQIDRAPGVEVLAGGKGADACQQDDTSEVIPCSPIPTSDGDNRRWTDHASTEWRGG
jgi:hypothetical protein